MKTTHFFYFFQPPEPHWYTTAEIFIYDKEDRPMLIRVLLDNKIKISSIRNTALSQYWPDVREFEIHDSSNNYYERPCLYTKVGNASETEHHLVTFAIANNDQIPRNICTPVLSRQNYDAFYRFCYENKSPSADRIMNQRRKKWMRIDGILGSNYFESFKISYPISENLTQKYKIMNSELGALLISLK